MHTYYYEDPVLFHIACATLPAFSCKPRLVALPSIPKQYSRIFSNMMKKCYNSFVAFTMGDDMYT